MGLRRLVISIFHRNGVFVELKVWNIGAYCVNADSQAMGLKLYITHNVWTRILQNHIFYRDTYLHVQLKWIIYNEHSSINFYILYSKFSTYFYNFAFAIPVQCKCNNFAEALAARTGLQLCLQQGVTRFELQLDSMLIVEMLQKRSTNNARLRVIRDEV